jgi:hypothetical protein
MLGGLPQLVARAARTPKRRPARIIHVLGEKNRFNFVYPFFLVNLKQKSGG